MLIVIINTKSPPLPLNSILCSSEVFTYKSEDSETSNQNCAECSWSETLMSFLVKQSKFNHILFTAAGLC